jgi:hypothetical protein
LHIVDVVTFNAILAVKNVIPRAIFRIIKMKIDVRVFEFKCQVLVLIKVCLGHHLPVGLLGIRLIVNMILLVLETYTAIAIITTETIKAVSQITRIRAIDTVVTVIAFFDI